MSHPFLRRSLFSAGAALALILAVTGPARAAAPEQPRYTAVEIGSVSSRFFSFATGINDAGEATGAMYAAGIDGPNTAHPMLLSGGTAHDLSGAGGPVGQGTDVNNSGAVAGWISLDLNRGYRAARWADGVLAELPLAGAPDGDGYGFSQAHAINDAGLIVGSSHTRHAGETAVLWRDGLVIPLPGLGGSDNVARDVNSAGLVVGVSSSASSGERRPVVWRDGRVIDLGTLGGGGGIGEAVAVNDAGWIVGNSVTADGLTTRAVLWRDGAVVDLGAPAGGTHSQASGINSAGDIIGTYSLGSTGVPFLYRDGVMHDIASLLVPEVSLPGRITLDPNAEINDAGQFVAAVRDGGVSRFYLFSPVNVPEPGAAGLAVCAAAGVLARRRRRG